MSTFDCKIRKITSVTPHPGADKLDLVQVGGYYAVCQKDTHKAGDLILYIQEDSLFTDMEIAKLLKVTDYLTGKDKNRVKAIRLRGRLSQGICISFDALDEVTSALGFGYYEHREGLDAAEHLKIVKYEEPIPIQMAGQVRSWPSFLPHYNIENVKRPESFVWLQEGEEVVVTEKLHGTNVAIAIGPGLEEGEDAFVCSRNHALKEDVNNVYWRAVHQFGLIDILKDMKDNDPYCPDETISLHGEIIGVQDLKYGLKNGEVAFRAFDIRCNGEFLNYEVFSSLCHHFNIPMVPELYRGPYNYDKINEVIQGKSTLADNIREGGVVKPIKERLTEYGDRVQVKFISDGYLLRKNGSEFH
jgi:RNA ligase (TIGR02306 family)